MFTATYCNSVTKPEMCFPITRATQKVGGTRLHASFRSNYFAGGLKMFAKSMWQPFEQRFVDIQATFERLSAKVQREAARCEAHFQHIEREKAESERQAAESERQGKYAVFLR